VQTPHFRGSRIKAGQIEERTHRDKERTENTEQRDTEERSQKADQQTLKDQSKRTRTTPRYARRSKYIVKRDCNDD
jgi:hypothetical protein